LSHSLFACYEGPAACTPVLSNWFRGQPLQWLASLEVEIDADLFVPETGNTALFSDGPGPAAMLEFSSPELAELEGMIADDEFRRHFHRTPAELAPEADITFGIFQSLATPVAGADAIRPRTAGLSFVVRYYGPMADEAAFQDFYTAKHPPILAQFPEIRNVFCYLPVASPASNLPRSHIVLGNEVVFDDLQCLNVALQSDIMPLLKADSARFPPFGHSTHHAMTREKLLKSEL